MFQGWQKYLNVQFYCFFFKNTKLFLNLKEFLNQQEQANEFLVSFFLPTNQPTHPSS